MKKGEIMDKNDISGYMLCKQFQKERELWRLAEDGVNIVTFKMPVVKRETMKKVSIEDYESRNFLYPIPDGSYTIFPLLRRKRAKGEGRTFALFRKKDKKVEEFAWVNGKFILTTRITL
jgi:hypothetical protein